MQADTQAEIVWRLKTAAGHLEVIRKFIEAGKPCAEVLHQLGAVEAALRVTVTQYLNNQIKQSEDNIINGNLETRTVELARLHKLYTLLAQQSDYESDAHK